jgi:uncharacterized Zn-binding protein involved in type VI secretion
VLLENSASSVARIMRVHTHLSQNNFEERGHSEREHCRVDTVAGRHVACKGQKWGNRSLALSGTSEARDETQRARATRARLRAVATQEPYGPRHAARAPDGGRGLFCRCVAPKQIHIGSDLHCASLILPRLSLLLLFFGTHSESIVHKHYGYIIEVGRDTVGVRGVAHGRESGDKVWRDKQGSKKQCVVGNAKRGRRVGGVMVAISGWHPCLVGTTPTRSRMQIFRMDSRPVLSPSWLSS